MSHNQEAMAVDPTLPTGFIHGYVQTNGIRLHYVQGGQGTPVVLLHGFPENWYAWRHVMPVLARQYHVIALDMRGAGQSDAPPTGYDKATLAQDVRGVVQELHLDSINLVGHDIGLMVAYFYAATYPTEVRHLVLMEAPLPDESVYTFPALTSKGPGLWWFGLFNAPRMALTLLQGREELFVAEYFRSCAIPVVTDNITSEDMAVYARNLQGPAHLNAYISYYSTISQDVAHIQRLRQEKLSMPVLALGGDHGKGETVGKQVQQYATHMRSVVIANSGHWLPEEHPEEIARQLISFFEE